MKIIELDETDSTNEYCKRSGVNADVIVTARRQSAGRGTKGRSFVSSDGGLYISVMRFYKNFPSARAFEIMISACVAVCRTVEAFGLRPVIRWANDVLVNGRKICGTLIENTLCGKNITRSIVGIGLNVNNVLPPELSDIAISMNEASGNELAIEEVKSALIKNLRSDYGIEEYKKYIDWFGREIILITPRGEAAACALDIDRDGNLVCRIDGRIEKISSAEVSLRLYGQSAD